MPSKWTPLRWDGDSDGKLVLLDQTLLPVTIREIECENVETVWESIRNLRVRGAPAIGVAAAYGVVLGLQTVGDSAPKYFQDRLNEVIEYLASSRPTAVNLFWALDRMRVCAERLIATSSCTETLKRLLDEARAIHTEDREICRMIGVHGAELLQTGNGVLTHCNAGALATSEHGTALSVIYAAHDQGKQLHVFADETRPLLQGSRLTAWELMQHDVDVTLICDSMAAQVMREGRIDLVIVGADRIAANGDTANKIGTYGVAVLARAHQVPFYVAAPRSTFDLSIESGKGIPIEQRSSDEVTHGMGRQTAPDGVKVYNPAFDVTPAGLIEAFICEHGLVKPSEVREKIER